MGQQNELDTSGAGLYTTEDGQALDSMLVVGEKPWHFAYNEKLIKLVERGKKIHPLEVNKAAGLDWTVTNMAEQAWLESLGVKPAVAAQAVLPSAYVNVRDDLGLKIGNVSKGYQLFQNAEAPEFMMNLVDSGDLQIETALSLYGGKRVVWAFKVPQGVLIGGDPQEKVETYLLLMNSHDGSVAITIAVTPIRVVCQNTLAWGLREATRTIKVRHTKNAEIAIDEARRVLGLTFAYTVELEEIGGKMLAMNMKEATFMKLLDSVVPIPEANFVGAKQTNKPAITMATAKRDEIIKIYEKHPTQQGIKGTLWGGVQAVQFYADHIATMKSSDENRFRSVVAGRNLGSKAFAAAKELVAA